MKRVVLLGCTGSIGRTSLRVLDEMQSTHRLVGLAAGSNTGTLLEQAARWKPSHVALHDLGLGPAREQDFWSLGVRLLEGPSSAAQLIRETRPDVVINGITGAAGLEASVTTLELGIDLALANKESMVMAGPILGAIARSTRARILPVDSEHSAVFQCLHREPAGSLSRIILTASGGPFRRTSAEELSRVTPAQALQHPTWKMGPKITIDSATLLNKALEVVEARWLFEIDPGQIEVVIHPQSIIHSMVEFVDGSILAQLGVPDMALPIRLALSHPARQASKDRYFDLRRFSELNFESPDLGRFPGLGLGFEAARRGGTAGAVLNAANEVAVASFLSGQIRFVDIPKVIATTMERVEVVSKPDLSQVLEADRQARCEALSCCS